MIACAQCIRGKSGLQRAGCRVTPGGGDSKDSATEIYRELVGFTNERKGGKVR